VNAGSTIDLLAAIEKAHPLSKEIIYFFRNIGECQNEVANIISGEFELT